MSKYELMFIVSAGCTEEQREKLIEKFKSYVADNGGKVVSVEKIGIKKFAYEIDFKTEGFYVLMNIELSPEKVDAMNKLMTITDGIVRQIFVRK